MLPVRFGYDMFGRTHRVPGVFWVSTRFFHVYGIPIFVKESWLVIDPQTRVPGLAPDAIPIPRNATSIWTLRARSLAILTLAAALVAGAMMFIEFRISPHGPARTAYLIGLCACAVAALTTTTIAAFALLNFSYRWATLDQARDLAAQAGILDHLDEPLDEAFGRTPMIKSAA